MSHAEHAREWDALSYDRLAAPMTGRGVAVVDRADLAPDARVLDAGCGTGQVSAAILERIPDGHLIALDGSQAMVDATRERLGDDPRVEAIRADLTRPLPLAAPVDTIISTSTLHWVPDHPALMARLAAGLTSGGSLHVDCGGAGNIAEIVGILDELGESHPWTFSGPEETEASLRAVGFEEIRVWSSEDPALLEPGKELEEYLATVILGTHLAERGPDAGTALVRAVAERMAEPRVGYVRLNIDARLR